MWSSCRRATSKRAVRRAWALAQASACVRVCQQSPAEYAAHACGRHVKVESAHVPVRLSERRPAGARDIQRKSSLAPGQVADAGGVARAKGRGGVPCATCTSQQARSRVLVPRRWVRHFLSAGVCAVGDLLAKFGMESVQDEAAKVRSTRQHRAQRGHAHACSHADGVCCILALLQ